MPKNVRQCLFLKAGLIGDLFRKHGVKKRQCIGAFGQIKGRHLPKKTWIIQREEIH